MRDFDIESNYITGKPTTLQMLAENYATKGVSKLENRTAFGKDPQSTEGLNRAMTREENKTAQGSLGVTDPMAIWKEEQDDFKTHEQAYQAMDKLKDKEIKKMRDNREFWDKAKRTTEGFAEIGKGIQKKDTGKMARGTYEAAEALGDFQGPTGTATAIEGVFSGDMEKIKHAATQQATEKIVENTIGRVTDSAAALGGATGAVSGLIQGQGAVESGVRGAASAGAATLAAPLGPIAQAGASWLADSVASLFFPGETPRGPQTKIGKETLGAPTAEDILTSYANA